MVPPPLEFQERAVALTADAGNLLIDAGSAVGSGLVSALDPVSSDPITAIDLVGLANSIIADPFPVLQQMINNDIGFADTLGAGLQSVGNVLGTGLAELPGQLQTVLADIAAGNLTGAAGVIGDGILDTNSILGPHPAVSQRFSTPHCC